MITSTQNANIKALTKLHRKKHRDETRTFLVDGEHLVEEAHRAAVLKAVFTLEEDALHPDAVLLAPQVMKKLAGTDHTPSIVGLCAKTDPVEMGERVLILEGVQDPGNVGTLLRSALAFGFSAVVLDKKSADPYNAKTLRASQGAVFGLSLFESDVEAFAKDHPEHTLIATVAQGDDAKTQTVEEPFALILGNEGAGLRPHTLALADVRSSLRTRGVESLNVAVAGSILMHRFAEQLEK